MLLGPALSTLVILTLLGPPATAVTIVDYIKGRLNQDRIDAYIVPSNGEHYGSLAPCERRIRATSGFTGSAGSVIITRDHALLWTDGRYWTQAEQELDLNVWKIMKQGVAGEPSETEWMLANLPAGSQVAVDPKLYQEASWEKLEKALSDGEITLLDTVTENFVDAGLEALGLPPLPTCERNRIQPLAMEFAGKTVAEKLEQVREKMRVEKAQILLVSELDEIAWLFNLRGTDVVPLFYAYALIQEPTNAILLVQPDTIDDPTEASLVGAGVTVRVTYKTADEEFRNLVTSEPPERVWVSKYANHHMAKQPRLIIGTVPHVTLKTTPLALLKAIKNDVEVEGMRNAHLRDSAAIVTFLCWLENRMVEGATNITEISAAEELLTIRELEDADLFVNASFSTISGFGPNSAIIHYRPKPDANAVLATGDIYLVDSGGHYKDGTTDITRTIFLGDGPRDDHRDRFTRVLKGHIALATSVFPNKVTGNRLDSIARKPLWDVKLDYAHGTGHGIGMYLNIHEGPQSIGVTLGPDDTGLEENMFMSNEPGYYKVDDYGVRIENIVRVAKADVDGFLKFETVSFIPIQLKLIDRSLLTAEEIQWVDDYHIKCREKVGGYIRDAKYFDNDRKETSLDWLRDNTVTLDEFNSGATAVLFSSLTLIAFLVIQHFLPNFIL